MAGAHTVCRVVFRACGIAECGRLFAIAPKLRTRYCSDVCSAKAIMARPSNRYSFTGAMSHLKYERKARQKAPVPVPEPVPTPIRAKVTNAYRPGMVAFTLLYGGTPTFSFNRGDDRVGRGGGRSARQVGGPSV